MPRYLWILIFACVFTSGCRLTRTNTGYIVPEWKTADEILGNVVNSAFDSAKNGVEESVFGKEKSETDKLWHAGYGYNNPNPDRMRKGLKPLNFDGTEPE